MTLKEMLLERKIDQAERLGCLMAMVDEDVSKKLVNFGKKLIKDEDLYHEINKDGKDEYGREQSPMHITVRYGFTKDLNELDVRQLLKGHKEFLVELYELDMFTDSPDFDVIKFKAKSPILNQLNEISGIYPNHNDYPEYLPHLTLGYVKKGTFPNLKKQVKLIIPIKSVEYSPISGGKSHFQLEEGNMYDDIDAQISKLEQEWDRLDATGTGSVRQREIESELTQLRFEKEMYRKTDQEADTKDIKPKPLPVDPNKAKELFKQMRQSINEIIVRLTKEDAQEILHKIGILNDNPDLQSDYGISQEQSNLLLNTIPHNGGDWNIPDWAISAVKGEIEDHIIVLRDIAQDAYNGGQTGQSLRINKQAKRLEILFGNLLNEWISHGIAMNRNPDVKLRATPGGQNDGVPGWNESVEDWDGIIKGQKGEWFAHVAGNDWDKRQSYTEVIITEDDKPHKMWIKIKTHGLRKAGDTNETYKERVRKHSRKITSKWISAAKKLHEVELNEVGNEIKKYWKESFKNSLESIKQYIAESGEFGIDPINFTYRK